MVSTLLSCFLPYCSTWQKFSKSELSHLSKPWGENKGSNRRCEANLNLYPVPLNYDKWALVICQLGQSGHMLLSSGLTFPKWLNHKSLLICHWVIFFFPLICQFVICHWVAIWLVLFYSCRILPQALKFGGNYPLRYIYTCIYTCTYIYIYIC